jgi:hypothetical protein
VRATTRTDELAQQRSALVARVQAALDAVGCWALVEFDARADRVTVAMRSRDADTLATQLLDVQRY